MIFCFLILSNIYAQYYPSKPKSKNHTYYDSASRREYLFDYCIFTLLFTYLTDDENNVKRENSFKKIYFPFKIGCGLAKGNWDTYKEMIVAFANKLKPYGFEVFICHTCS